jgi:hypothetical protein
VASSSFSILSCLCFHSLGFENVFLDLNSIFSSLRPLVKYFWWTSKSGFSTSVIMFLQRMGMRMAVSIIVIGSAMRMIVSRCKPVQKSRPRKKSFSFVLLTYELQAEHQEESD